MRNKEKGAKQAHKKSGKNWKQLLIQTSSEQIVSNISSCMGWLSMAASTGDLAASMNWWHLNLSSQPFTTTSTSE
jgi:hypothetical protein